MLDVIICEDDQVQREKLNDCVDKYIFSENLAMKIALSTENPNEVINYVKKSKKARVYFFDVDLKSEYNGITLAAEIRKYDPTGAVIFITTHPELTYLTFIHKVAALDYIVKTDFDQMVGKVQECLKIAYTRFRSSFEERKVFQVDIDEKSYFINYEDILFFESESTTRKVILYTKTSRMKFLGKLKDIEKLDSCFCRCHNSFVVNRENIVEINKNDLTLRMINGDICEASRRGIKELLKFQFGS